MSKLAGTMRSGRATVQPKIKSFHPPLLNNKLAITKTAPSASKTLLQALSNSPNLSDAKRAFDSAVIPAGVGLTELDHLRFHNSLLQSYAGVSSLPDSIALLHHMIKTSPTFSADRSTYHIILAQACGASDPTLATVHRALNLMAASGFPPDKVCADIAVRALVAAGRVEHALELFEEMSLKNSVPDTYTYNFLVKCLCKCRSLSTIYTFIEKTRSASGIKPDLVTYTILIDNVCNTKNLREMTRLVGVLSEEGFKPDRFLYNTIMKGYCMLSRGSEAIEVYNKMKESGAEPDLVTYNTLIFGLSKAGRAKEARKYLKMMQDEGHVPDVVTYTSLMNGLCRERDTMGAFALLEEMEASGCAPNSCTYNTLLHGFFKARMVEKGIAFFQTMKEAGIELESTSYDVMVRTLCRGGRVVEAYEAFDYAVMSKSLTDVAAYATLESTLRSLKQARDFGRAS